MMIRKKAVVIFLTGIFCSLFLWHFGTSFISPGLEKIYLKDKTVSQQLGSLKAQNNSKSVKSNNVAKPPASDEVSETQTWDKGSRTKIILSNKDSLTATLAKDHALTPDGVLASNLNSKVPLSNENTRTLLSENSVIHKSTKDPSMSTSTEDFETSRLLDNTATTLASTEVYKIQIGDRKDTVVKDSQTLKQTEGSKTNILKEDSRIQDSNDNKQIFTDKETKSHIMNNIPQISLSDKGSSTRLATMTNDNSKSSRPEDDSQAARLKRIKQWCSKNINMTAGPWRGVESCIVNEDRKVIFCPLPKVGCTSWKLAMVLSTDEFKKKHPDLNSTNVGNGDAKGPNIKLRIRVHYGDMRYYGLKRVGDYPPMLREKLFKDYFKFMFVREPLDRLLSAYRDKLESNLTGVYNKFKEGNLHSYGKIILQRYRKNVSTQLLSTGRTVTFGEFLRYVNDEMTYSTKMNEHWKSYNKILNMCGLDFDFIGKKETWDADLGVILPKVFPGETQNSVFPTSNVTPGGRIKPKNYFDSVDPHLIKLVTNKFRDDFELFGYDPEKYS